MCAEEEQAAKVSTSFKTDDTDNRIFKYHDQFELVDNVCTFNKAKPKTY